MAVQQAEVDALAADVAGVAVTTARVTGAVLEVPDVRAWTFEVASKADFQALVSACYTWWKEDWAPEIQTLAALSRTHSKHVRDFTTAVNNIRTSHQHNRAPDAVAFASAWTVRACGADPPADAGGWKACGEVFGRQTAAACAALAAAAAAVEADPRLGGKWAQTTSARISVDTAATTDVVMQDLGLSFSPFRLRFLRGQVDRGWERRAKTRTDDAQAALDAVVETVLAGASLTRLPCGYPEILDRLGLIGDKAAVAVLWLAHAVAEQGYFVDTAEFLDLVERLWNEMVAPPA